MTIAQRINAERIVLFGWSRAILLQLAHPLVAAGVAEHSTFREGRFTALRRLHGTVRAMTAINFGRADEREAAVSGILRIHRRVNGHLATAVGPFPAGTPYSAEDPALVLWVHATLLESLPLAYQLLVAPLTNDERDQYCRESVPLASALGARPGEVPASWSDLIAYMERMYASGQIVVSDTARGLSRDVLAPRFGMLVAPAANANLLVTTALLPEFIRKQYGLTWAEPEQRAFARWVRVLQLGHRMTPRMLRLWPEARRVTN